MDLPLLSAVFAAFSITMYVLLDGFDLGVGALLLLQPHEASRNHMVDSLTPTWDGNETWLIMTGVTLLAGFPLAYSILMPAFYVPLIVMLLALGLRGVSFEFRPQAQRHRPSWDAVFSIGSIVAACMQGVILGGLIQGVTIRGGAFGGSVFDCLRPFPILCAASVLFGYIVLGGCWLYLKTTEASRHFAERTLWLALPAFLMLFVLACLTAAFTQPEVRAAWKTHAVSLATIAGMMALAAIVLFASLGKRSELRPLVAAVSMVGLGIAGLAVLIFPDIIPFRLSLWEASASRISHVFLLSGAVFVTPLVLAYSAFAYWVFRGKTPVKGWEA
jgi:cytochrome bd ubiquinol oxidase subunit II